MHMCRLVCTWFELTVCILGGGHTPLYRVHLGCICLTSSSRYQVRLDIFILMIYDGLIIYGLVMFRLFSVYILCHIWVSIGTCYTVTHIYLLAIY